MFIVFTELVVMHVIKQHCFNFLKKKTYLIYTIILYYTLQGQIFAFQIQKLGQLPTLCLQIFGMPLSTLICEDFSFFWSFWGIWIYRTWTSVQKKTHINTVIIFSLIWQHDSGHFRDKLMYKFSHSWDINLVQLIESKSFLI